MRIVIAGGSGFLGSQVTSTLDGAGHELLRLVRRPPEGTGQARWRPERGELNPALLEGADAVINLAGAGVGDRRWTDSYKKLIRSSRVDTTATIAATLARMERSQRPRVLLNASAEGYYGDTGDAIVDEDSPPGDGFLAEVCREWEAATGAAEEAGVRVVKLRTGLPLDARGGLLKRLLLPFRFGVGGKLAGGRQWMPWVAMADWNAAVSFLLAHDDVAGPVNLASPHPVTNEEFTKVLARLVRRPSLLPIPRIALRVALGEFADDAVVSTRMLPAVLLKSGFEFRLPDLEPALRAALAPH